jgi:WD40 repeat protein
MKTRWIMCLVTALLALGFPAQGQENDRLSGLAVISTENASDLEQLAVLGQGTIGGRTSNTIAWSPDGETIALAGSIGVWLYEVDNLGAEPRLLEGHTGVVNAVTFSPDGRWLASGGDDQTVRLWDMAGEVEHRVLTGHENEVIALAFSPDGIKLVSGEYGDQRNVFLWDVETGEQLARLEEVCSVFPTKLDLEFSPNGEWLACYSYMYEHWGEDGGISLWNLITNEIIYTEFEVGYIDFTPDGHLLVGWSDLSLYDVESLEEIPLDKWSESVGEYAVVGSLSPDATRHAYVTARTTLHVTDLETNVTRSARPLSSYNSVEFGANGIVALGGASRIHLWDSYSFQPITTLPFEVDHWLVMASSPDGRFLATEGGSEILVWDISNAREDVNLAAAFHEWASSLALSSDGGVLAVGRQWTDSGQVETLIWLWDVESGTEIKSLDCISPRGGTFMFISQRASSNLPTAQGIDCFYFREGLNNLVFGPDDTMLAMAGYYSDTILIWDISNDSVFSPNSPKDFTVNALAFSPDGRWLAFGTGTPVGESGFNVSTQLWEVGSDMPAIMMDWAPGGVVFDVAFSPDSTILVDVSGDASNEMNVLRLWDVESKELLAVVRGHTRSLDDVTFSLDGTLIATASDDGTVRLWGIR